MRRMKASDEASDADPGEVAKLMRQAPPILNEPVTVIFTARVRGDGGADNRV
ncbi:hypothetical protein [Streptomyces sp. NPDC001568]|uniref:hypothetical protein n=1 Tax=Streptomyces sp. NPDC001568 TaxID=3364588 RepID=UPI0036B48396